MKLPSAEEYLNIVAKKVPANLATLYNHRFLKVDDAYLTIRGRNTIIFKTEYQSKFHAVRFFLNDDDELFKRHHQIQNFLNQKPFSWKVPSRFMDEEYYPVIVMDWMESLSFTEYLDSIIYDASRISKLQQKLISLSQELERNGIGHGNLNMNHIRFVKQDEDYVLKLIDYDSMFIPQFKNRNSFSAGTPGFQHPRRLASDFSEKIDRFSFWVFLAALEAFKIDPLLWINSKENGLNKREQILFTYRNLAFPEQSAIFETLRRYSNRALNFYLEKLLSFCLASSLDLIGPPILFEREGFDDSLKRQQRVYGSNTPDKQPPVKAVDFLSIGTTTQDRILLAETAIVADEENNGSYHTEQETHARQVEEIDVLPKKRRKKSVITAIIILVSLLSVTAYIAWKNQFQNDVSVLTATSKPTLKLQEPVQTEKEKETTVFTSPNIGQFLSQLYQSYNQRNLSAILSNYADSLTQYYDAGSLSKNKLGDVIKDLFITPAYYECKPDLKTLQVQNQGNNCKMTIDINEKVKAYRRSKTENYSSKIEYIIDTSFKITAEKNIK